MVKLMMPGYKNVVIASFTAQRTNHNHQQKEDVNVEVVRMVAPKQGENENYGSADCLVINVNGEEKLSLSFGFGADLLVSYFTGVTWRGEKDDDNGARGWTDELNGSDAEEYKKLKDMRDAIKEVFQ